MSRPSEAKDVRTAGEEKLCPRGQTPIADPDSIQFENEDDDYQELVDFQFSQTDDVGGLEIEKLSTQDLIVSGNRNQSEGTE